MSARRNTPPLICLVALAGLLGAGSPTPAQAGDLDGAGTVYLRLPFSIDGDGFREPNFGLQLGPSFGSSGGPLRVERRKPRFLLDRAFTVETDGRGKGRLRIATFTWSWTMPALDELTSAIGTFGSSSDLAEADHLPNN